MWDTLLFICCGILALCGVAYLIGSRDRHEAELIMNRNSECTPKPLHRFKIEGKVIKHSEAGTQVLAHGGCIREAESAEAIKAAWLHDMRIAYPIGPDYNVDYWCEVTPLDDVPPVVVDDKAIAAATTAAAVTAAAAAAAAATTIFR